MALGELFTGTANVTDVAHVIQLSVAPVFLLTGIGALLGVMTNRLARIIDRARKMEELLVHSSGDVEADLRRKLKTMSKRAKLTNFSISLCVMSALMICCVIVALFVSAFIAKQVTVIVGYLFIASMLSLIGALLSFLREIYISTAVLRIGPH